MLKKYLPYLFVLGLFLFIGTTTSSCSKKSGCPVNENATVKTDKKGRLSSKKGKSNLFPKKMRKN